MIGEVQAQDDPVTFAWMKHYSVVGNSTSCFSLAILRMSSVIFIEQYLGPHMLQKCALLKVSCGKVSS